MPPCQSHFPLPSYGTLAAPSSGRLGLWCNLISDSGRYIVTKEQGLSGRHTWGAIPFLGPGESLPLSSAVSIPRPQGQAPAVSRPQVLDISRRHCFAVNRLVLTCIYFFSNTHVSIYDVKYTTLNPIQLPTTPRAEYALVNINGRNS